MVNDREPKISQFHIDRYARQGCGSWDEYCKLNQINYSDLFEEHDDFDEDNEEDD